MPSQDPIIHMDKVIMRILEITKEERSKQNISRLENIEE